MAEKHSSRWCDYCGRQVMAVGSRPNHVLHLILTLFTLGLWAIVWLLVGLLSVGGYRCSRCGQRC